MASYPLHIDKNDKNLLTPSHDFCTKEFIEERYDLSLSEEYAEDGNGRRHKCYRLHAKQPHSVEMALAYDIRCPDCTGILKPVGRMRDSHDLFLYECRNCKNK